MHVPTHPADDRRDASVSLHQSSGTSSGLSPEVAPILLAYGWRPDLQPPSWPRGLEPARVLAWCRGLALALRPSGEGWCRPSGRFRDMLDLEGLQPCAGDWLGVDGEGRIHDLLPRRTLLARQEAGPSGRSQALAAHVDHVFLAMGLDRDFNPARLERLLALAWGSGARPTVLLTKADLVPDPEPFVRRLEGCAPGVGILVLSTPTGAGLPEVLALLAPGTTGVVVGSSGVGKSTLLNALLGTEARKTSDVRARDGRGRHTTSLRELFLIPGGGCLIDTPGLREVGLLAEASDLGRVFTDVESAALACRYRDCRHEAEPGCAVQAALLEGSLEPARFEAFLRLRREVAYAEAKADERLWREREERWKGIAKQQRKFKKG